VDSVVEHHRRLSDHVVLPNEPRLDAKGGRGQVHGHAVTNSISGVMWESLEVRTQLLPAVQVNVVSASTGTEQQPAAAIRNRRAVPAPGRRLLPATTLSGA
jgi:hypothetical protein